MKSILHKPDYVPPIQPQEIYNYSPNSPTQAYNRYTTPHKRMGSHQLQHLEENFNFIISIQKKENNSRSPRTPSYPIIKPFLKVSRTPFGYNLLKQAIMRKKRMPLRPNNAISGIAKPKTMNTSFHIVPISINRNIVTSEKRTTRTRSLESSKGPMKFCRTCDERGFKLKSRGLTSTERGATYRPTTHFKEFHTIKTPERKPTIFPLPTKDWKIGICQWEDNGKEGNDFTNEILKLC